MQSLCTEEGEGLSWSSFQAVINETGQHGFWFAIWPMYIPFWQPNAVIENVCRKAHLSDVRMYIYVYYHSGYHSWREIQYCPWLDKVIVR